MEDKRICVVCPVCGAVNEVETYERYTIIPDDTYLTQYCAGACSNCETELHWEEVYELLRVENVRPV